MLASTMEYFTSVPLAELGDPFDRFILATAAQLRLPLVTADRAISITGVVEVIRKITSTATPPTPSTRDSGVVIKVRKRGTDHPR